jgi:uncharacterized membrane-anchored protein YhcB (DUF1043 family)
MHAYKNNLDYYKTQYTWERYRNAIKSIVEDDSEFTLEQKQTHLLKETREELVMMFNIHEEIVIEFIRMFYTELYQIIAKSTPEETIDYLQKELALLHPV